MEGVMATTMVARMGWLAAVPMVCLSGCLGPLVEQTITTPLPHVQGSGLQVKARNGTIVVKRAEGNELTIVAMLRMASEERIKESELRVDRSEGNVVSIRLRPPEDKWQSREGCSFEISLPDAVGVTLDSGNGSISLSGMSGPAKLKTSNGRITVAGHDGPVEAETSNGSVKVEGVSGRLKVRTSNGAISAEVAGSGPVELRSSNGAISLDVTRSFAGTMRVETSNGSIVTPKGVEVEKPSRGKRLVKFGGEGEESAVRTSNGSVTVRVK